LIVVLPKGLKQLKKLTNLKRLDLTQTQVTAAGQKEIKEALPKLEVGWIAQFPDWYELKDQKEKQRIGQVFQNLQTLRPDLYAPPLGLKQFEESQKSSWADGPGGRAPGRLSLWSFWLELEPRVA
jgi:hypothetical protein